MLYKQGVQKIEIIVRKDTTMGMPGTNGLSTQKASVGQEDKEDLGSNIDEKAGIKQKTLGKFVGKELIQLGKQAAFKGFDYFVGGIGMANGDQALQAQIGRKIEIIQDTVNFGTAAIGGAMLGATFGPIGSLIGGAVGVASAGISFAFRQAERERTYNYETFKSENAIQYLRARAELNTITGRVR